MKKTLAPSVERAQRALASVLPPGISLARARGGVRLGATRVALEWVGDAWPSQVADVIAHRAPVVPVILVASHMGRAAREMAERAGVSWLDETGAAAIALPGVVVARDGRAEPASPTRWTRATLAVVEAILADPAAPATVKRATEETGLSSRACELALRLLRDEGLLEADVARGPRAGRRVRDPRELLDAYCRAYGALRPPLEVAAGVSPEDLADAVAALGRAAQGAATGLFAAQEYAPALTSVGRAVVLVDAKTPAEIEAALRQVHLRPIDGGRLVARPFVSRGGVRRTVLSGRLRLAPWPAVVADARAEGVRGEEAADHLREIMLPSGD